MGLDPGDAFRSDPELAGSPFEELAAGYYVDLGLFADRTLELLRTKQPIPKSPPAGFDGRLLFWLQEHARRPAELDTTWSIVLRLIAGAPSPDRLVDIGAGPLEDLLDTGGPGLENRVLDEADRSLRFRQALRHVWPGPNVPPSVRAAIAAARTEDGYIP